MIDLTTIYVRGFLRGLQDRVRATADALAWYEGDPEYIADQLLPAFTEGSDAERDFLRFALQTQSPGPLALRLRRQAAVSTVTWSQVPDDINDRLDALHPTLRRVAKAAAKHLFVNGITAVWPVIRERVTAPEGQTDPTPGDDMPTLQHLGGHLELLWEPDDVGGTPVGLLQITGNQATHEGTGVRYDTRIWDFTSGRLLVWLNIGEPYGVGGDPTHVYPTDGTGDLLMPTVVYSDLDQYGLPVGEGKAAMPMLRQAVAVDMRVLRTSQAHAFPVWALSGRWEEVKRIGANTVLRARDGDARAERVNSGDLQPLFDEREDLRERVRQQLVLPITGAQSAPSGEAYVQANVAYNGATDELATLVGEALTPAVRGYLALQDGTTDPTAYADVLITVKPDRELKRSIIGMQVREDYRVGLVSRRMALGELEPFYPNSSTDEVEAWIATEEDLPDPPPLPPASLATSTGDAIDDDGGDEPGA